MVQVMGKSTEKDLINIEKFGCTTVPCGLPWAGLACVLGLATALPSVGYANLVQDGSFEDQVATQPYETFSAGQSFGGWTVTAGNVNLVNGAWLAADGNQSVGFSGNSPGTIQQTIVVPAGNYLLTFDLSGDSTGLPITKTIQVSFGGATKDFSFTTTGSNGNMNWALESWDIYLPTGGSTVLSFADVSGPSGNSPGDPYYGAALDNVSLTDPPAVPESGTLLAGALLLFPVGLSAVRILRNRRAA